VRGNTCLSFLHGLFLGIERVSELRTEPVPYNPWELLRLAFIPEGSEGQKGKGFIAPNGSIDWVHLVLTVDQPLSIPIFLLHVHLTSICHQGPSTHPSSATGPPSMENTGHEKPVPQVLSLGPWDLTSLLEGQCGRPIFLNIKV
jgi:hypothetical protein